MDGQQQDLLKNKWHLLSTDFLIPNDGVKASPPLLDSRSTFQGMLKSSHLIQ